MNNNELQSELRSIRHLMERSAKFISLSGLSGVLAGCYALAGAALVYQEAGDRINGTGYWEGGALPDSALYRVLAIAFGILLLSVGTAIVLSTRNAGKRGQSTWNPASRGLMSAMLPPLLAGGIFAVLMLIQGYFGLLVPICLIFYGLALVAGGPYTFRDVKRLGYLQIGLGLFAAIWPGYGLVYWVVGFGLLHILYGLLVHFKYERRAA